jgi:hypothetical protein
MTDAGAMPTVIECSRGVHSDVTFAAYTKRHDTNRRRSVSYVLRRCTDETCQ